MIVDPGLYLVEKTDMFFASQKRELPKAFKLFSGITKPHSLTLCCSFQICLCWYTKLICSILTCFTEAQTSIMSCNSVLLFADCSVQ